MCVCVCVCVCSWFLFLLLSLSSISLCLLLFWFGLKRWVSAVVLKQDQNTNVLKRTLVLIKQCYKTTSFVCFWVETNKLMNKKCSSSRQTANKLTNDDRNGVAQNICFISDGDLGGINISSFFIFSSFFSSFLQEIWTAYVCACVRLHASARAHTLSLSLPLCV